MANLFNSVLQKRPRKNAFNLSYDHKSSGTFGRLMPVHVQECIPGDIFKGKSTCLLRFAPLIAPIMHRVNVYTHFFFVPNRILWPGWEDFITGNDETLVPPWFTLSSSGMQAQNSTLVDYLGMPSSEALQVAYDAADAVNRPDRQFSAFPLAAYQRIWWEYYRDQNIEFPDSSVDDLKLTDGENSYDETGIDVDHWGALRKRNWTKDYFTSALPWPQKGDAATIPVGFDQGMPVHSAWSGVGDVYESLALTRVNVAIPGADQSIETGNSAVDVSNPSGTTTLPAGRTMQNTGSDADLVIPRDPDNRLRAYPAEAADSAGTIEDLRRAFRLQEWLERNARGGTRYIESIFSHFGERVADYRLDRPEYIGGNKGTVQISEVLSSAETLQSDDQLETPVGYMGGHGISAGYSGSYSYKCQEHGFIIGIMSVIPTNAYFQGVPRHFGARKDRLDYFWPTFAHLGEQAIQNKELLIVNDTADEDLAEGTFGYTPRYAEYRFNPSRVSGDMNTLMLDWHLARKYPTVPSLNATFMNVDGNPTGTFDELDRIFAVQDGSDYLWFHVYHQIKAIRPMPRFATPF